MRITTLMACAISCLLASQAQAEEHFVFHPDSIQAAIAGAQSGDRILVGPGTYGEVLDFAGKQLEVVASAGPLQTTIDGSGHNNTVVLVEAGEPEGTLISGFTLTGGAGRPHGSSYGYDYYGGGLYANGGARVRVENCVIQDNGWGNGTFAGGVYSGGSGTHVSLVDCVIAHNRAWASGGATLVDWYGTMSFESCTVYGNSSNSFFGQQGGISMANYGTVDVRDTIVWANEGAEIGAFGAPYDQGTHAAVNYSCVEGGYAGSNNISSDPLFADLEQYRLLASSPCVDSGDPTGTWDEDGSPPDRGARHLAWTGAATPFAYCEGKASSAGCLATMGFAGTASLAGDDDFHLLAWDLQNQQFCGLIVSLAPDHAPFAGAARCIAEPFTILGVQNTGGSSLPASDCSGTIDFQVPQETLGAMGGVGAQFFAQVWFRDPVHPDGSSLGVSAALGVTLLP
ncbi:MAG: right-handed parallel beta-helix repeat-containing protein [Planctomycetota bacterium]|jgi:hypothetical protein|nr:right-handed parallel beta-helix repeat-containing protein [Planctomycetota bacterium]